MKIVNLTMAAYRSGDTVNVPGRILAIEHTGTGDSARWHIVYELEEPIPGGPFVSTSTIIP